MKISQQTFNRWLPLDDIPDSPCADFALQSPESGKLILTLKFSLISGNENRDLMLTFNESLAMRTFWDGDQPVVGRIADPPRCSGVHSGFVWPLLLVENSQWLVSGDFGTSITIAEGTRQEPWLQYTALTLERSIDVLARGDIRAEWVAGEAVLHG